MALKPGGELPVKPASFLEQAVPVELKGTPDAPLAEHARVPLDGGGVSKVLHWPENLSKPAKEAAAKLALAEGRLPAVKPVNLEGPVALKPGGELPVKPAAL